MLGALAYSAEKYGLRFYYTTYLTNHCRAGHSGCVGVFFPCLNRRGWQSGPLKTDGLWVGVSLVE